MPAPKYVELNGEFISQREYCRRLNYNYDSILSLMRKHKVSFKEAVEEYLKPANKRKWAKRTAKDKRLYQKWRSMMGRCYNPKNPSYPNYGGRKPKPIQVCERWHDYFNFEDDLYESFIEHVEDYGIKDTTIDRWPDKLGDYELTNIRWATRIEQANNLTTNIIVIDNLTLAQFADKYDLDYVQTLKRYHAGWSIDEMINPSLRDNHKIFAPTGENLDELAERLGLTRSSIEGRLKAGYTWDDIMTIPLKKTIYSPTGETFSQIAEKLGTSRQTIYDRYIHGWDWSDIVNKPIKEYVEPVSPTGETLTQLAERLNITKEALQYRLNAGWTWEKILNTDVQRVIKTPTNETLEELSKKLNIPHSTLYERYKSGWDWADIVTIPVKEHIDNIVFPNGETSQQLAERLGISADTVRRRVKEGYTLEEIERQPFKRNIRIAPTGENIPQLAKRLGVNPSTIRRRLKKGWSWDEIIDPSLRKKR